MFCYKVKFLYNTNKHVIDLCNKFGKKAILNLAPARELEDSYLSKIYLLVVNENEAEIVSAHKLTSNSDIEDAADIILSKGPANPYNYFGCPWFICGM